MARGSESSVLVKAFLLYVFAGRDVGTSLTSEAICFGVICIIRCQSNGTLSFDAFLTNWQTPRILQVMYAVYLYFRSDINEAFELYSKDGDNKIHLYQVGDIVRALGECPTNEDVNKFLGDPTPEGNCRPQIKLSKVCFILGCLQYPDFALLRACVLYNSDCSCS